MTPLNVEYVSDRGWFLSLAEIYCPTLCIVPAAPRFNHLGSRQAESMHYKIMHCMQLLMCGPAVF